MRGEDGRHSRLRSIRPGSPPHARGRRDDRELCFRLPRITPACAGKTWTGWARSGGMADHPRMRGEDGLGARLPGEAGGSPPHARGRPSSLMSTILVDRITPACAGKTLARARRAAGRKDHPRMRGEDVPPSSSSSRIQGSPPHARGRLCWPLDHGQSRGITPACAGKTDNSDKATTKA